MPRLFSLRFFTLSTVVLSAALFAYRNRVLNEQAMAPLPVAPALANFSQTAVFLGGTSGIALALAQLVSRSSEGSAKIVLVGRNKAAAEAAFERMRKEAPPSAKHEYAFEQCDLGGGFDGVHSLADRLKGRYGDDGVSMLVMSPGYLTTAGRTENVDGVDKKMAVHLYSRMLVAKELIPLLEKAAESDPKQGARVYTILDSKRYDANSLNFSDLDLKDTYTLSNAAKHACGMNNVMVEQLAARYPTVSFTHGYPGVVNTNIFSSSSAPSVLKWAFTPIMPLLAMSPEKSAEGLGKVLWQERYKTGAWRVDETGEPYKITKTTTEEQGKSVWDHISGLVDRK